MNTSSDPVIFGTNAEPHSSPIPHWVLGLVLGVLTYATAFWVRLQEWPSWQETEFRLGNELLLATHDAYHWVAGAEGFEFGAGHPMSELLRILGLFLDIPPAQIAFWLPPVLASLVAVLVFLWAWSMGSMEAGFSAGILASLAPAFLARTLLGYADTDLVSLFLPLLAGLAPAAWVMRFLRHPLALLFLWKRRIPAVLDSPAHSPWSMLSPAWVLWLGASGLLAFWAQEWHSLLVYLVRYNVILFTVLVLLLARKGEHRTGLLAVLCFALPALGGIPGALFPFVLLMAVGGHVREYLRALHRPVIISLLALFALVLLVDLNMVSSLFHHLEGYLKRSGDAVIPGMADPLVFPSVAQSIIEIQDLSFADILTYFHPWAPVAIIGLSGFCLVLLLRSGALFLLPLLALAFLSTRMGGRMVMFGAPVIALGLVLVWDWLICLITYAKSRWPVRIFVIAHLLAVALVALQPSWRTTFTEFMAGLGSMRYIVDAFVILVMFFCIARRRNLAIARIPDKIGPRLPCRMIAGLLVFFLVVPPLAELVPSMTHGPILNRRHADALRTMQTTTPPDAMIWHWWDWGYATHHFAHRHTIADGAEHGGPSLYLPAAVYATSDPRFARQLIKYTAAMGKNRVFDGHTSTQAAELIALLKNPETPLVNAQGKQYLIVSFDMLDLGFWISTFGNWDFTNKEGRGHAISIVPQGLNYRLDIGLVAIRDTDTKIPAASIDVFSDGQLDHRDYVTAPEYLPDHNAIRAWKADIDRRRNVHFIFNRVTGEKLVIDDPMYNTLMVRLLVKNPDDPTFSPWFRLIYDNVFCRIYEVL